MNIKHNTNVGIVMSLKQQNTAHLREEPPHHQKMRKTLGS